MSYIIWIKLSQRRHREKFAIYTSLKFSNPMMRRESFHSPYTRKKNFRLISNPRWENSAVAQKFCLRCVMNIFTPSLPQFRIQTKLLIRTWKNKQIKVTDSLKMLHQQLYAFLIRHTWLISLMKTWNSTSKISARWLIASQREITQVYKTNNLLFKNN